MTVKFCSSNKSDGLEQILYFFLLMIRNLRKTKHCRKTLNWRMILKIVL